MLLFRLWPLLAACCLLTAATAAVAREPVRRTWTVQGMMREALVWMPERRSSQGAPLVFVFHGHGGTARQVIRSMPVPELWPDAVVVSMQGLPTPGQLTDRQGRESGWQARPGDQGDRDLAFFDAVLATAKLEFGIDDRRVYATGHSNGGGFTYLLWAVRRDVFAAFAPSSAIAGRGYPPLAPAPVFHVAGRSDPLVKFAWQEKMIESLRRLNGCAAEGRREGGLLTRYESTKGCPVVTFVHPGGHRFPTEATQAIVDFFRGQRRP